MRSCEALCSPMQVSGVLPAACLLLPAVEVVAQGMVSQSVVQVVSPTSGPAPGPAPEMEKLPRVPCQQQCYHTCRINNIANASHF